MNRPLTVRAAQYRVARLKAFYIHLTVFVLVMLLLTVINLMNGAPYWVIWPFLGWGLGLIAYAAVLFGPVDRLTRNWERRQIRTLTGRN